MDLIIKVSKIVTVYKVIKNVYKVDEEIKDFNNKVIYIKEDKVKEKDEVIVLVFKDEEKVVNVNNKTIKIVKDLEEDCKDF